MQPRKQMRLGEMLVAADLVTEDQLRQALAAGKRAGLKLGQQLVRNGVVKESDIVDLISRQMKLAKYTPDRFPVDPALAELIPAEMALRGKLVPLSKDGSLMRVAMPDPLDVNAIEDIEIYKNCEVEPVICTEKELGYLTSAIYGMGVGSEGVLESIESMRDGGEGSLAQEFEDVKVSSLEDMAGEAPVVRFVNSLLSQAVREGASDVHISPRARPGGHPACAIDGKLKAVTVAAQAHDPAHRVAHQDPGQPGHRRQPHPPGRPVHRGHRPQGDQRPRLHLADHLRREPGAQDARHERRGPALERARACRRRTWPRSGWWWTSPTALFLATGPTGSGKSTTLFSLLREISRPDINVITLEDPVEYRMEGIRQVQLNRKAGMTFASALRSTLRQDPDVVLVGEIRDAETAAIATQAALTGHKVLSTVHTNDAAGAVMRLMDMGIEPFLVSSVLVVSIAQRLVRRVCPNCAEPYTPSPEVLRFWNMQDVSGPPSCAAGAATCAGIPASVAG